MIEVRAWIEVKAARAGYLRRVRDDDTHQRRVTMNERPSCAHMTATCILALLEASDARVIEVRVYDLDDVIAEVGNPMGYDRCRETPSDGAA